MGADIKKKFIDVIKFFSNSFVKKLGRDYISAFSAQTTFFLLISFFPFLIIFITLTQYLHLESNDIFLQMLSSLVPAEFINMLTSVLHDIYSRTGTVLSVSLIALLWSASKGISAIITCLNNIYKIKETRNYFVVRFFAIIYTIVFMLMLLLSIVVFVFGRQLYELITSWLPNSMIYQTVDNIINIRAILGIVVFFVVFICMYKFLPSQKILTKYTLPGAIFSTIAWMFISYVFSIYINYMTRFSYIYGSLSGVIIALLWLYFCVYIIFIGAEINYFYSKNIKNRELRAYRQ